MASKVAFTSICTHVTCISAHEYVHTYKIPKNKPNQGGKIPYNENLRMPKEQTEEDTRRLEDLSYLWLGRLNIMKMAMLLKVIYVFNATLLQSI